MSDCARAQQWADHLASNGLFEHSSSSFDPYGENLYVSTTTAPTITYSPGAASIAWYETEEFLYNYPPDLVIVPPGIPDNFNQVGHFTQMVWTDTTEACFASAVGTRNGDTACYVVGHYNPPGNFLNQFETKVPPKI